MVNSTRERMFKTLQPLQYYLINDKSIYIEQKNIDVLNKNSINLNSMNLLKQDIY